jgi:hypothetical protein
MSLTGKTIGQLTLLGSPTADTLLPVQYDGDTYRIFLSGITSFNQVTYSELFSLYTGSTLTVGRYYLITDFQTCYDQPDFDQNGNSIITDNTYKTGATEPLVVFAISNEALSAKAYSIVYPSDDISYDIEFNQTERTGGPAKGRITERIDNRGNRTDYDFRAVLFKRYDVFYSENYYDGLLSIDGNGMVTGTNTLFSDNFNVGDALGVYEGTFAVPSGCFRYYEILTIDSSSGMTVTGKTINPMSNVRYSKGFSISERSYHQTNLYSYTASNEFNTFIAGDVYNVKIGNFANVFNWQEYPFILSNNVFFGGSYLNIVIGDESYDNTFDDDMDALTLGNNFYRNIITNDFDRNTVGNYFRNNIIVCDMADNNIGNYFQYNMLGDNDGPDFDQNRIGNYFEGNFFTFANNPCRNSDIGDNFSANFVNSGFENNKITGDFFNNNIAGQTFDDNIIGNNFYDNYINQDFYSNQIGRNCYNNDFWGSTYRNNIGSDFYGNTLFSSENNYNFNDNSIQNYFKANNIQGGDFYLNTIGSEFMANETNSEFYYNVIGNSCFPNTFSGTTFENTIGNGFQFNVLYGSFAYNQIGQEFNSNEIQDGFGFGGSQSQGNIIGNNFYNNYIGEYFYNNTIADNFTNNSIFNYFQWNNVQALVNSNYIYSCVLYSATTVNVFMNSNGDIKLSYFDESDVLTVESLSSGTCVSFTIQPYDINEGSAIYLNTTPLGVSGRTGFENTAPDDLGVGYFGQGLDGLSYTQAIEAYNRLGLSLSNSTGYIWNVTWGDGSSYSNGLVKFGANLDNQFFDIQPIDTSDPSYLNPNSGNGTSLVGTFKFPATFTIYLPLINKGGWC